jgi:hypothetical protein
MHFLFNLLRIKSLHMFRALLAHGQEVLHKRHLVYWYDMIWYDIFNCNWVDTRWRWNSTHLHTIHRIKRRNIHELHYWVHESSSKSPCTGMVYPVHGYTKILCNFLSYFCQKHWLVVSKKVHIQFYSVQFLWKKLALLEFQSYLVHTLHQDWSFRFNPGAANWHNTHAIYQVPFVQHLLRMSK